MYLTLASSTGFVGFVVGVFVLVVMILLAIMIVTTSGSSKSGRSRYRSGGSSLFDSFDFDSGDGGGDD